MTNAAAQKNDCSNCGDAPRAVGWDICPDCVAAHERAIAKRQARKDAERARGDHFNDLAKDGG